MKVFLVIPFVILLALLFHMASAEEVLVHGNEFKGYFDSDGIYTVFGSVRNMENQPVLAKVQVTVNSDGNILTESTILPVIYPSMDMPFKFKFPEITQGNPVLDQPKISYITTNSMPLNLEVIYDNTLTRHPDGHLTGFVSNVGNESQKEIRLYALVHAKDNELLDEVQSGTIASISPGEKVQFALFPDPTVAKKVTYYSCFVPGADNAIEMSTQLKGKKFYFSVLSIVYFTNQKFNDQDTSISFDAANPWQLPYFANFMFPAGSSDGDFKVFVDGKQLNPLISKDGETGNWHVAFNVDFGQHKLVISGFNPNYVPNGDEYFYLDAKAALTAWGGYSTFTIPDSLLLHVIGVKGEHIPFWVKHTVKYMMFDNLPRSDIVNAIKYLSDVGIVK